jgi:hypothetical protein
VGVATAAGVGTGEVGELGELVQQESQEQPGTETEAAVGNQSGATGKGALAQGGRMARIRDLKDGSMAPEIRGGL